ncbi:MAG: FtsX-like permease family protein [Candidatus Cryptobacteroides sp.]|nr:FtsX-like permease family protein [Candidatus Cryptobacteroides sp.]
MINVISAISVVGMAIGTAALTIILSIYNGFDSLVRDMMGNLEPDILITPSKGKVFVPEGECYDWIYAQESVASMCTVLQEQVFISYDGHQGVAIAKGMDAIAQEESPIRENIRDGKFEFRHGDIPEGVVGVGLAYKMGINPRFLAPIQLYYPSRTRKLSPSSPSSSIEYINIWPSGLFSINSEIDNSYILLDIDKMRELLEYSGEEVSAVEIRMKDGCEARELKRVIDGISERLGEDFTVSDRFRQNESLYKMMKYEKASIYLILIFVILIIGLNIHASLSMLIIEKREDIATLRAMGAGEKLIRRVFVLEGWFISLLGLAIGLLMGLAFCLLQQRFGLISMPGNFVIQAYPVVLKGSDLLITALSVAILGYLIAAFTERLSRS